jgi:hypothetical protein
MKALAPLQDENGMWREAVELPPERIPSFPDCDDQATAMLQGNYAKDGLKLRRIPPIVVRAWQAILIRTSSRRHSV